MILEGERSGALTHDKTLIDATSGNTGIAYAMIGAARGYKVKLCLPMNASIERKRILKAYGAELVLTPADEGSDGAIRKSAKFMTPIPTDTSTPISTTTTPTGRRTTKPRARKSSSRPRAALRIS